VVDETVGGGDGARRGDGGNPAHEQVCGLGQHRPGGDPAFGLRIELRDGARRGDGGNAGSASGSGAGITTDSVRSITAGACCVTSGNGGARPSAGRSSIIVATIGSPDISKGVTSVCTSAGGASEA
jgi:hypothetical protein